MCRHIAYWGPRTTPAELVLDAPRSLLDQCTAAREMSWGQDNLDGWGIAWTLDDEPIHLHRRGASLTEDLDGQRLLRSIHASRYIVHVRQMTPGSTRHESNSAPFSDGAGRFFTHNGYVDGFRDGVRDELLAKLSARRAEGIRGDTDSEVLFALVLSRIDDGAPATEAIRAVADVATLYGGRYNVLFWDTATIIATRWDNSLYVRDGGDVVVTSEPLDEGPWTAVAERTMVVITGDGAHTETL